MGYTTHTHTHTKRTKHWHFSCFLHPFFVHFRFFCNLLCSSRGSGELCRAGRLYRLRTNLLLWTRYIHSGTGVALFSFFMHLCLNSLARRQFVKILLCARLLFWFVFFFFCSALLHVMTQEQMHIHTHTHIHTNK